MLMSEVAYQHIPSIIFKDDRAAGVTAAGAGGANSLRAEGRADDDAGAKRPWAHWVRDHLEVHVVQAVCLCDVCCGNAICLNQFPDLDSVWLLDSELWSFQFLKILIQTK